ncbi:MAG: T9SS type A sorting domain-containing protein [Bacteroidia bacterium]
MNIVTLVKTSFLLFSLLFAGLSYAQIASPEPAQSMRYRLPKAPSHTLSPIPIQQLLEEDQAEQGKNIPPRFGHPIPFSTDLKNHGLWTVLPDGGRVWRLRIVARGAYSINFVFDEFYLPEGGTMHAYNDDRTYRVGAFTSANHQPDGKFATAPIKGEAITIELFEPAAHRGESRLRLASAVHAYVDLFEDADRVSRQFGTSGRCNNDVACKGTGWEDQISSVGMIIVGTSRSCSGAIVNNTLGDGRPYFLTADHCLNGPVAPGTYLSTWVFVFNYESPTCNGPDGSLRQSITGGTLQARFFDSDFALIEMTSPPPASYNVTYAGWDKRDIAATASTAIHHPSSDVKKISFNNDTHVSGPGLSGVPNSHWRVTEWEDGTTEGGSSGSPIFDQNKRVVGQLNGGDASCDSSHLQDDYGKLSMSWDGGGNSRSRLSDWLDPTRSGDDFVDGSSGFSQPRWEMALVEAMGVNGTRCDTQIRTVLRIRNLGLNNVSKLTIDYQYDSNPSQNFIWTGAAIPVGQILDIRLPVEHVSPGSHTFSATISAPNDSADAFVSNNQLNTTFTAIKGNPLLVRLFADDFPQETRISIHDQITYAKIDEWAQFKGIAENRRVFCLEDGCYTVTIADAGGDGLIGNFVNGYMLVEIEGERLDSIGPNFRDSVLVDICVPLELKSGFRVESQFCQDRLISPVHNAVKAVQFEWLAPGAIPATSTDELPEFRYPSAGMYTMSLVVTDQNGNTDTSRQSVQVDPGIPLQIDIRTDAFPEENSYRIFDKDWNEVGANLNFDQRNANYTDYYCLAQGCYTFVLYDNSGDGMCCEFGSGSYTLTSADGSERGRGGQFGAYDTVEFCLYPVGVEPPLEEADFALYPNPAQHAFYVLTSEPFEQLVVFDAFGKRIWREEKPGVETTVHTASWPSGMYIVQVFIKGGILTERLVVRK